MPYVTGHIDRRHASERHVYLRRNGLPTHRRRPEDVDAGISRRPRVIGNWMACGASTTLCCNRPGPGGTISPNSTQTAFDSPAAGRFDVDLEALLSQEFPVRDIFFVKDPRIARFLPFWLGFADRYGIAAKTVIPLRNPLEVAASLRKRDGFSTRHGLLLWLRHVLDAEAHSRGQRRVFTSYEDLLQDWRKVAKRMGTLLEIDWPRLSTETEAGIDALISAGERHQDAQAEDVGQLDFVPNGSRKSTRRFCRSPRRTARALTEAQTRRLDEIRGEFDRACSSIGLLFAEQREGFSERLEKAARRADEAELDLGERNVEIQSLRQEIADLVSEREDLAGLLAAEAQRATKAEESLHYRFAELSDLGEKYTQLRLLRFYAVLDSVSRRSRLLSFRVGSLVRSRSGMLKRLWR